MNILDIIIICIIGLGIIKGYKQGFFKTFYKTCWIFVVWFLYPYVNAIFLKTSMAKNLNKYLSKNLNFNFDIDKIENVSYLKALEDFNIIDISTSMVMLEEFVINLVFMVLTFVIIAVVINIGMIFVYNAMKLVLKFPPLNLVNKIGGIVIGGISGLFNSVLFIAVIFIVSMFENFNFLKNMLNGTIVNSIISSDIVVNFILRTVEYYDKIF